jgi:outer membrane protein assembly factor BamB
MLRKMPMTKERRMTPKWLFGLIALVFFFLSCTSAPPTGSERKLVTETQWIRSTTIGEYNKNRQSQRMEPVLTEKMVFQGNAIDGFTAFNRSNGSTAWQKPVEDGASGGAVVDKNTVYFGGSDGFFYAVNATSGEMVWKFAVNAEVLAAPTISAGRIFFLSGNNSLYSLDLKTGAQKWMIRRDQPSDLTIRGGARPAVAGTTVYGGFTDGFLVAFKASDGSVIWERQLSKNRRFRDIDSSPVVDGNYVYTAGYDGALYCLTKEDGQIAWRLEEGGYAPVTIHKQQLFYATSTGKLLALDKKSGKRIWEKKIKHGIATQPSVFKGMLVYGETSGALKIVNILDGKEIHSYEPGRGLLARPVVDDEKNEIYLMSNEANVHALKVNWRRHQHAWPWESDTL